MWKRVPVLCACVCLLALLSSCGGGGGIAGSTITRANDSHFSTDAKALAARIADSPWLPADKAAVFDADLQRIRTQYPQVADIHTIGDFVLTDLLIAIRLDAPWRANWEKGMPATGDPNLDRLLTTYKAISVQPNFIFEDHQWFLLTFSASLNTRALVPLVLAASSSITYAEVNGYGGDGDNITFEQTGSQKKYVLSHGWGDCPSGCIERHYWTFTFTGDGSITLEESGHPIPPDGGRKASEVSSRPTRAGLLKAGKPSKNQKSQ